MNVLFVIPYSSINTNNLTQKFLTQINCAGKIVDRVFFTEYCNGKIYIVEYKNEDNKICVGKTIDSTRNFFQMHYIMTYIRDWVRTHKPDIVYMRSTPPTFAYKKTLEIMHEAGTKVIVEIPTYPIEEEANNSGRKLFFLIVKIVRFLFDNYEKYVDLYTLIGEHANSYKGIKAVNIENGIDIDNIPLKSNFQRHDNELHLLAMANIAYWHGYDRIVRGLVDYYKEKGRVTKKVILHICGNSSDDSLEKMMNIAKDNGIENYIELHGFLKGEKLIEMFDLCDIAIGSLGMHRMNRYIDTSLKATEYTSRGIPFIYCARSNNIDINSQYCLRYSEDEQPIDIHRLIQFFDGLNKKTISKEMRMYAEKNLDWSSQLKIALKAIM